MLLAIRYLSIEAAHPSLMRTIMSTSCNSKPLRLQTQRPGSRDNGAQRFRSVGLYTVATCIFLAGVQIEALGHKLDSCGGYAYSRLPADIHPCTEYHHANECCKILLVYLSALVRSHSHIYI